MCSSDLGALPQREMGSIKSGGASQEDPGSKKFMALPVSIKSGGAATARIGQIGRASCRERV